MKKTLSVRETEGQASSFWGGKTMGGHRGWRFAKLGR